ncbi:hypothetical protein LIER_31328 [Lithospermum erythrorhizon]|uniref:Uncharacterized protein n=1 Tax=Lithospermum erythrorhizon TaxID=34254 RepID=A0AAV3RRC0_LITER
MNHEIHKSIIIISTTTSSGPIGPNSIEAHGHALIHRMDQVGPPHLISAWINRPGPGPMCLALIHLLIGPDQPKSSHEAYTTTDIEQAMHTLGLNPPDTDWYMDTGVTSHMTSV